MRNEGNIMWGCCVVTSSSLSQKCTYVGTVRATLSNTKFPNVKSPFIIKQSNVVVSYGHRAQY